MRHITNAELFNATFNDSRIEITTQTSIHAHTDTDTDRQTWLSMCVYEFEIEIPIMSFACESCQSVRKRERHSFLNEFEIQRGI